MKKLLRIYCSILLLIGSLTLGYSAALAGELLNNGTITGGAALEGYDGLTGFSTQIIGYVEYDNTASSGTVFTPVGGLFNGVNQPNLNIINFTPYNIQFTNKKGSASGIMPYAATTINGPFTLSGFTPTNANNSRMNAQPLQNSIKIPLNNPNNLWFNSASNNAKYFGSIGAISSLKVSIAAANSTNYQYLLDFNVASIPSGQTPQNPNLYDGPYAPMLFSLQVGNSNRQSFVASQAWATGGQASFSKTSTTGNIVNLMSLTNNSANGFDCNQMINGLQYIPYSNAGGSASGNGYWQTITSLNGLVYRNITGQLGTSGAGGDLQVILQSGNNAEYSLIFVVCSNAVDTAISPSMYLK